MTEGTSTVIHNALIAYGEWQRDYAGADNPERKRYALTSMIKALCILGANDLDVDALIAEWEGIRATLGGK